MSDRIKLFIVDDHQMFVDGIKALLRNANEYEVVGSANNGNDALKFVSQNNIDIVLTDISMPGMSGIELTEQLKSLDSNVKVLVVSMYSDKKIIEDTLLSGADGFILKNTGKKELTDALTRIANHGSYFSAEILAKHIQLEYARKTTADAIKVLSDREQEVLGLIVAENSSEVIAEKLFISKRTVDTHRKNIMEKTGCKSLVALIKYAIRNNIATQ